MQEHLGQGPLAETKQPTHLSTGAAPGGWVAHKSGGSRGGGAGGGGGGAGKGGGGGGLL